MKLSIIYLIFILGLFISPSFVSAQDYLANYQTYFQQINYDSNSPAAATAGKGAIVAIIDQGVWSNHPDLVSAMWHNLAEIPANGMDDDNNGYIDDVNGWNFVDNNSNTGPKGSHGTMVAGIIASEYGQSGIRGIAPASKIMPLTACYADGNCDSGAVINAIRYAIANGATVINLSLNHSGIMGYQEVFDQPIREAYAKNIVITAASGNGQIDNGITEGIDLNKIKASPISNDADGLNEVLGVGAIDATGKKISWSNYGDKYVDVYAPGKNLLTTTVAEFADGYGYEFVNGTSFATALVSGAVALLQSQMQSQKPALRNYEIIDAIKRQPNLDIARAIAEIRDTKYCRIENAPVKLLANEILSVTGRGFYPGMIIELKNGKSQLAINPNAINILDASHLQITADSFGTAGGVFNISGGQTCSANDLQINIEPEASQMTEGSGKPESPKVSKIINETEVIKKPEALILLNFIFKNDLHLGMKDPAVRELQIFLNKNGFKVAASGAGSFKQETTYFGPATKKALAAYQKFHSLPATGFLGPLSRALINK